MIFSICVLSFLLFSNVVSSNHFPYPTSTEIHWNPVSYKHLKCPQYHLSFDSTIHKRLDKITVYRPIYNDNQVVEGYLCRKVTYITRCTTNWLFSSSINKIIHGLPVSKSECIIKIQSYIKDELLQERFKEPKCIWNQINDVENVVFEILLHKVKLDPYTNNLIDPLFPGGITHPNYSGTIHDDTLWISSSNKTFECTKHIKDDGVIYTASDVSERNLSPYIAMLHIDGYKDKTFKGSCQLEYCGRKGVRFTDGEWMEIVLDLDMSHNLTNLISDIEPCEGNVQLKLGNQHQQEIITMDLTLETIFRLKCEEVISKLINNFPVSPYDISFLAQAYPGPGSIYQLQDRVLMQAQGFYHLLTAVKPIVESDTIGLFQNGSIFKETRWFIDNKNISHGLNGLVKMRGTIRYPGDIFHRVNTHESLLRTTNLVAVSHPTVISYSSIINRTDRKSVV